MKGKVNLGCKRQGAQNKAIAEGDMMMMMLKVYDGLGKSSQQGLLEPVTSNKEELGAYCGLEFRV